MAAQEVDVHLYAAARAAVGFPNVRVPAGSVRSVGDSLCQQFPALASVLPRCSFLIDGMAVHDLDCVVLPGSQLDVLPPFAGG